MRPRTYLPVLVLVVLGVVAFVLVSATPRALLNEHYAGEVFRVPRRLADSLAADTLVFFAYGDTEADYRVRTEFVRRETWLTWRQILVPFYQIYLLGEGLLGGINYARHHPDAGAEGRVRMRRALAAAATREQPAFFLHLGDLVADDGRRAAHWAAFLDENRTDVPLLLDHPFLPTPGDREFTNDSTYGLPNYEAVFGYPRFYVLDTPVAALFVLDSNLIVDQEGLLDDSTQQAAFEHWFVSADSLRPSWLERALAARAGRPFKIVAMHHPPVSFGERARDWNRDEDAVRPATQRLLDVFRRYRVALVLSGHEHLYEHDVVPLRRRGEEGGHTLHVVVSSGGGAPLRPETDEATITQRMLAYEREGLEAQSLVQTSARHFNKVTVTADTLTVTTYTLRRGDPGFVDVLDRFAIVAPERPPGPD